jgi:dimethylaniline monooxygenase (N-oxide forming)
VRGTPNIGERSLPKRVAVIGAGPSGLVTVKELLDEGHEPTCFERAGGIGGIFRFGEADGVVWESCRLTSSTLLTAFSDFPMSGKGAPHLPVGAYVEYLTRYAEAFDLLPHIRFNTTVEAIRGNRSRGWTVCVRDAQGSSQETFDAVARRRLTRSRSAPDCISTRTHRT